MNGKDEKRPGSDGKEIHGSVEEILKERMRLEDERKKLDQMIKDQYQKDIVVMFTDLKGSTSFFETYGDIEGRAHIEKHNSILFPVIARHSGKIVKTMGDAIMAMFEDPEKSVLAAMEMQKELERYNAETGQRHKEIHIRIGLNFGPGVVEATDVFGDVVNVAARVEGKCEPDQILISESLYQAVRQSEDILCRFFGEVDVKGKTEAVRLYRVVWSEDQLLAEESYKMAGVRKAREKKPGAELMVELNISREGGKLKVSAVEHHLGQEKTVQQYQTVKINENAINQLCLKVVSLLNQANRRGRLNKEILKQMEEAGQSLYDQLLPREAKEKLEKSQAENLLIRMDDQLVQIPWELLYNGAEFLCIRFNIGRIVSTRQKVTEAQARKIAHPLKMLALADPRGDLPESAKEGAMLRDELDHYGDKAAVNLKVSKVERNYILSHIRDYDLVHYAGHADYDPENPAESGWMLADGKLRAEEIANLTGKKPMPVLVFANGCQSGQTEAWKIADNYEDNIFGLANAFLVSGVQHYIGTFWEILDEPGREFALAFYREILDGASVGESVRLARKHLIDKYGEETIVWASYMLYGDPSFSYLAKAEPRALEEEPVVEAKFQPQEMQLRGAAMAQAAERKSGLGKWIGLAAVLVVVLGGVYLLKSGVSVKVPEDAVAAAYAQLEKGDLKAAQSAFAGLSEKRGETKAAGFTGLAAVAFQKNDLAAGKDYATKALSLDPQAVYPHVILGNISYNQGDSRAAESEYRAAIAGINGKTWMKSEAYNRLGRLASEAGQDQAAVQNYQAAVQADPKNEQASVNLGQKLLSMGKTAEAQTAFKAGLSANPNDQTLSMLMAESLRRSQEAVLDKERGNQINQEISQLVQRYKQGKIGAAAAPASEEWTSRPMTMALIDFGSKGRFGMEGVDDFFRLSVTNALKTSGRAKVVEREMLDKILQELNLSSSELAREETRLQLGKLFSARMIGSGSIMSYAGKIQVNLRMIETETSEVKVAITSEYPESMSTQEIASNLVAELTRELAKAYPLRGEIVQVSGDEALLNIGSNAGLKAGTKLRILEDKKVKIGNKLTTSRFEVGTAEVSRVEPGTGYAQIKEPKTPIKAGMKVEEVTE